MKNHPFFAAFCLITVLTATLFTACRKGIEPDGSLLDVVSTRSNAQMQNTLATFQDMVYEAVTTSPALNTVPGSLTIGQCPQVTVTPKSSTDSFPATMTIDFGNGCNWRGHDVSGKIVLTVSGKVSNGNATLEGQVADLNIDDNHLGCKIVIKTGSGSSALRNMTLTVTEGTLITDDNKTVNIQNITMTRTQVEGQNTTVNNGGMASFQDDVFEIVVTGTGTGSNGEAFELSTPTTLRRSMTCRWIATGEVTVESGLKSAGINFGSGECDNQAVVTIAGEEKTINLK